MEWQIGRTGKNWTGPEVLQKLNQLPGRLELVDGKLCFNEEERRTLLAGLLENVGMDEVLTLGDIQDWREALAARADSTDLATAHDGNSPPISHWNCREIASTQAAGETWFAVHEVYYANGLPRSRAEAPAAVEWSSEDGVDGGERRLEKLREALRKPVLRDQDFPSVT